MTLDEPNENYPASYWRKRYWAEKKGDEETTRRLQTEKLELTYLTPAGEQHLAHVLKAENTRCQKSNQLLAQQVRDLEKELLAANARYEVQQQTICLKEKHQEAMKLKH
ncbi:unnamed protein product, partial [Amoebophrya sp. A25]|eukprot:GSA25T00020497001.1